MSEKRIRLVTFALLLSNAMSGLDNTIINTALPRIISDLKGIEYIGWIVAIFLLGTAVSTPLWSKLGEHIGNKTAYQLSASAFVLGALLQGLAPNMLSLLAARLLAGIGNGGIVSIPYIIYSDLYPNPRSRMKILGLVSSSYSATTILGPMLGGWIVDLLSWHWIFYLNVPVGLISIILVQSFFVETKTAINHRKTDFAGACLLTSAIVSLLVTIQMIHMAALGVVLSLLTLTLVLLGLLVYVEKRANDPVIPGRLFKNQALVFDFVLFVLIWGALLSFSVYAPMWAQGLLATSAFVGGATQIPGALTSLCGSLGVSRLRQHLSPHQVILLSVCLLLAGCSIMALGRPNLSYILILVAGMLQGFGNGMVFNELQIKVQQDAEDRDVPAATAFSFLIRMIASAVMASIFGLILNTALLHGVARHPGVTINMMNHLSDAQTEGRLPTNLLPIMRHILYLGIHHIMITALLLIIVSFVIAMKGRRHEKRIK